MAKYLVDYIDSLPVTTEEPSRLDLTEFTNSVLDLARENQALNQIVIPVLQTFDVLLDGGMLGKLGDNDTGKSV